MRNRNIATGPLCSAANWPALANEGQAVPVRGPPARCVKREPCGKPNSKRLAACCGDTRDYRTVTFGNALSNDGLGEKASHHAKNPPRKTRQMPTSIAQWQPAR
jgi:hypothetical protein